MLSKEACAPLRCAVPQDASAFADPGEELSFTQMQARAASVRQVRGRGRKEQRTQLMTLPPKGTSKGCSTPSSPAASLRPLLQILLGWYKIPTSPADPLELVVNPSGLDVRSKVGTVCIAGSGWTVSLHKLACSRRQPALS